VDSRPAKQIGDTARGGDIRPGDPAVGRPPDAGATDSIQAFKADLDRFRQAHPRSGYAALARRLESGDFGTDNVIGRSTLNEAIGPDKSLPQARTVRAMVLALTDGDEDAAQQWVSRRNRLAGAPDGLTQFDALPAVGIDAGTAPAPSPSSPKPPSPSSPKPPSPSSPKRDRLRRVAAWTAVIIALVASNTITYLVSHNTTGPTAYQAHTGDNPMNTPCTDDARIAATSRDSPAFLLELIYSPQCDAGWGRITRSDDLDMGNEVRVDIYRLSDPTGPSRQPAVEPNAHSAFTTVLVRSDPTDRLCVTGSIITGGVAAASARPLCI
jgi:hypothetical protein